MSSCFTLSFQIRAEMVRLYKFSLNLVKSIILVKYTCGVVWYTLLCKGETSPNRAN
jgi:hypothetical protein